MNDNELINEFITEQKARSNSSKTILYYTQAISAFQRVVGIPLADVTANDIKQFVITLQSQPKYLEHPQHKPGGKISKSTIHTYFTALRGFYNWAYGMGYTENIFVKIKAPKNGKHLVNILSVDEIEVLLSAVDGRNKLLVMLLLDCGLRVSEATGLTPDNVHNDYIKVCGKGDKERIVPLSDCTSEYLHEYIKNYPGKTVLDMSNNAVKMVFQRLKRKTGIKRLHPHLLRHTFATVFIYNGGSSTNLQYILGHASQDIIQIYVELAAALNITRSKNFSPLSCRNQLVGKT